MAQGNSGISQHKRMAMGQAVTGMKKGGMVHDDAAADKKMIKSLVKPSALAMKKGGKCK